MNCLMTKESTNSVQYSEVKTIMVIINTISWSISNKGKDSSGVLYIFLFCKVGNEITKLYLVLPLAH